MKRLAKPHRRTQIFAILVALLSACAQPELEPVTGPAPELPRDDYEVVAQPGTRTYQISTAESLVLIRASSAGRMKHLGHDHIIASEDVAGFILLTDDLVGSHADLQFPLRGLIVDKAIYRDEFDLDGEVSVDKIEGTYRNMQSAVLESALFPYAQLSIAYVSGDSEQLTLSAEIRLHGNVAKYHVPVRLLKEGDRLSVTGTFPIQHSDFGMTPFSAVGGLVRVAEEIALNFSIVAYEYREPDHKH